VPGQRLGLGKRIPGILPEDLIEKKIGVVRPNKYMKIISLFEEKNLNLIIGCS